MRLRISLSVIVILALSLSLAWVSTGFESFQGWVSFLVFTILGMGVLWAGWWALRRDPKFRSGDGATTSSTIPPWLGWLLVAATLLRLGVGVLWYVALPKLGYGNEAEVFGYVMSDAFRRDMTAWDLAQSEKLLSAAFSDYRGVDQYGGMLFGSALAYRYLGGGIHRPLQMVVLMAAFSSLTVLFTWAFSHCLWDEKIAAITAWIVALFPDAVLLGSSQMREALMMTLAIMAFYGLVRTLQNRSKAGTAWMILPVLAALPLSPLFALLLSGMLVLFAFFIGGFSWLKDWRVWVVLVGVLVLGLLVFTLFGERILPGSASNPVALLQLWLKQAARWQAYNSRHASGWMQKIFRSTPEWTHTWLLLTYGVARPFLPAALFDPGAAIWQGIAIWRSLGWALLLPFMIVAPFVAWRRYGWRSSAMGLSILVWVGILIASFRGGGDAWDNPRYRVTWIGLQAALAAWVWVTQRRDGSPWLRRVLVTVGLIFLWFVPWYLGRMTAFDWPIKDVFLTFGFGLASALVYWMVDVWRSRRKLADN